MSVSLSRVVAGVMNWGSWGAKLSISHMADLISGCVEIGVTSFDHADIYGHHTTEKDWGAAFAASGISRSDIQIVTKCGIMMPSPARASIMHKHYDTSNSHIIASVDNSLQQLQTDYIDLLLIHRPSPLMDPAVISSTVDELMSQGKIRHFGVSNFSQSQMSLLGSTTNVEANQIEVSPLALSPLTDGTLDYCMSQQVVPMAWSPLAGGRLFGSSADIGILNIRARLVSVSKKYGWSLDEMIYKFLLHHPAQIRVVTGTSKIDRIQTAVNACKQELTDSQWFEIYAAAKGSDVA